MGQPNGYADGYGGSYAGAHEDEDVDLDALDMSDIDTKHAVERESGLEAAVLVDGIPAVGDDKREKLVAVLRKRLGAVGRIKEHGIVMPTDAAEHCSKGFAFVEYETADQATDAIRAFHGTDFDKRHKLALTRLTDVDTLCRLDEAYHEPPEESYVEGEHIRSWLGDRQARDQFVTYRADDVTVAWHRKTEPPESAVSRPNWTETYIQWSPLGSYLASIHRQGVQIWGGPSWNRIMRFPHPYVKLFDFSPKESYLVTWSHDAISLPPIGSAARESPQFSCFSDDDEGKHVCVWDAQTGTLLRSFESLHARAASTDQRSKVVWPMFKWSADEKYFARLSVSRKDNVEVLQIFQAPHMTLLDKQSVKIIGLREFEWSPSEEDSNGQSLLCYWTPEINNQPARVALMSVPSKEIIRTKNLFNVSDCKLHWQSLGDYLCIKVDRHNKTKKFIFTNLELFHIRQKNIPVEVIEIKEIVVAFAWEPKSDRFVILTTPSNDPNAPPTSSLASRTSLSVYCLDKSKGIGDSTFKHFISVDKKTANSIFFSPKGRFFVIASLGHPQLFELEFYDLDYEGEKTEGDKELGANVRALLHKPVEHYGMTDIEWDPTGRYVASVSSVWRHPMDNGFQIRDFKGTLLFEEHQDKFKQLFWRPRPPTLLSKEEQKKIRKNLRDYSKIFDEEDTALADSATREAIAQRRRQLQDWRAWRQEVEERLKQSEDELATPEEKAKTEAEHENEEIIEEWVEEVIEEKEEIVD